MTNAPTETKRPNLSHASGVELTELKEIKRDVVSLHEAAATIARSARDKARQALAEALLCGQKLIRAKEIVGHGQWLKWVEAELPIARATVGRYITLASNYSELSNLDSDSGLWKAYVRLGICADRRGNAEPQPVTPQPAGRVTPQNVMKAEVILPPPGERSIIRQVNATSTIAPDASWYAGEYGHKTPPGSNGEREQVVADVRALVSQLREALHIVLQNGGLTISEARSVVISEVEKWQ